MQHSPFPTIFGALPGQFFFPSIASAVAVQSFWRVPRTKKCVVDLLRGVNASAVGSAFAPAYRLWEIEYVTPGAGRGQSLAMEPWWVVVAAGTYAGGAWFKAPPGLAIVIGAVLGRSLLVWRGWFVMWREKRYLCAFSAVSSPAQNCELDHECRSISKLRSRRRTSLQQRDQPACPFPQSRRTAFIVMRVMDRVVKTRADASGPVRAPRI